MSRLVLGTRGSELALWQARWVRDALAAALPDVDLHIEVVRTAGDAAASESATTAAPGFFTGEIERALTEARVDLAVHSLKDLPTRLGDGLTLAAVPVRADAADVLVTKDGAALADLPAGARVLTGSPRRRALLLHARPDLEVAPVRGNVPTRLARLDAGAGDGLVLAAAGLARLGLAERASERLAPAWFVPAAGQGALAVEARADGPAALAAARAIDDASAHRAAAAERAVLAGLQAGCRAAVGAWARRDDAGRLALTAAVADAHGRRVLRRTAVARPAELPTAGTPDLAAAEALGRSLADALRADGAAALLAAAREARR